MAPTLQDVSFLLGLSLAGHPIGPMEPPLNWDMDLNNRFAGVYDGAPTLLHETHGPKLDWLMHFRVSSTYLLFGMRFVTTSFYCN